MGRPTDYHEGIPNKVLEYVALCVDEIKEFHKTRGEKSDSFERIVNVKLPTIEGLSLYLDVHKDTIFEWNKKYPAFSDSLNKLKAEQAQRVLENGLAGTYNPVIAKLILSNNHGYRDKQDITSDGKALPTPIIALDVQQNDSNPKDNILTEED